MSSAIAQPKAGPKRVLLSNGWSLTPAGRSLPLGDLPLNIAVSPSQKLMAVTNNGQSLQSVQWINPVTEKLLHSVEAKKNTIQKKKGPKRKR